MSRRSAAIYLGAIVLLLGIVSAWHGLSFANQDEQAGKFDGARALQDVQTQVEFGPRIPGTPGHDRFQAWIRAELEAAGWIVEIQTYQQGGHPVENILARRTSEPPELIIGAHYDTRIFADQDPNPELRDQPVPGANDGASGVAVLLGLARSLPSDAVHVWLVFFDSEDNGRIGDWDWILGSRAFVANNTMAPRAMVNLDMIGDADLNIYFEHDSDLDIRVEIWQVASDLGYGEQFIPTVKYTMLDDHRPFLEAGIQAVEIIDFDYPYWHTTQDTPDKVSADSLQIVGDTMQTWIMQENQQRK
jgi:Zn-dependent M28 family amino/carboxypeptidase